MHGGVRMKKIVIMLTVAMFLIPSMVFFSGVSGLDSPKTGVESTITPTASVLRTACFDPVGKKGLIAGENGTAFVFEEYQTRWINLSTDVNMTFYGSAYRAYYDYFYLLGYNVSSGKGILETAHYYRSGSTVRSYDIDTGHSLTIVSAGVTGDDAEWDVGHEYVYESSSSSVTIGDTRCLNVPTTYTANLVASGSVTLGGTSFSRMPAAEHVTLTYSVVNGTWDVRGSLSGLQVGKATTGASFTFDSGINANRVELYLTTGTPVDRDTIDFDIKNELRNNYQPGSVVGGSDSDVATPLKPMEKKVGKDLVGNYYIDKDNSGTVSAGDVRINSYKSMFPRYMDRSDRLTGIDFSDSGVSGAVVGYDSQVYTLTSAANMAAIAGITDVDFEDVTYVGGTGDGIYLAVGANISSNDPAFYLIDAENKTFLELDWENLVGAPGNRLTSIDWNADLGYGIAVGNYGTYYKVVKKGPLSYVLESLTLPPGYSSPNLNSVRWTHDASGAMMCGDAGVMFLYSPDSGRTVVLNTNTTKDLFSVGVRGEASPGFTYVVGSGGTGLYYSYTADTSSTITADVYYPHITSYGLKDEHGFDIDNKMTDVDSNISLHIQGYYEKGWSEVQIDFYAWYDSGGSRNTYDINESDAGNSTRAVHLRYTGGSNGSATGTWSMLYPLDLSSYGFGKTVYLTNESESVTTGAYEYHDLFLNLSFGPQMFRSLNDAMTFVNDSSPSTGFNDADTWNYQIVMADASVPTSNDTIYSEFGLYQYTAITVTGSPSGSAAPGSSNVSLKDPGIIKYSSNTYYAVDVSITNLTDGSGHVITADNVRAINWDGNISGASEMGYDSGWPIHFPAADTPVRVWGDSGSMLNPGMAGNYTYATWPMFYTQDRPVLVDSGDIDIGRHLTYCPYIFYHNSAAGMLDEFDYYYHTSGSNVVEVGDIRLTRTIQDLSTYEYPVYSVVKSGDLDVGMSLYAPSGRYVSGPDDRWTRGEAVYVDASSQVSAGDYRVTDFATTVYWYLDIPVSTPEGTYTGVITYTIIHQ